MDAGQWVDQMKTGWQRFVADVTEKIDNSDVTGRDHPRRSNQQNENDKDDEKNCGRSCFHGANLNRLKRTMSIFRLHFVLFRFLK